MTTQEKNKQSRNKFAKYGGLAFQLAAYIAVGYFVGKYIDTKLDNGQSYGAAFGATLFLIVGLYSVIRDIISES